MSYYGKYYGVQQYGGKTSASRLVSIDPILFPSNGGTKVVAYGIFYPGVELRVYVGATGTAGDAPCYSGQLGSSLDVISDDGSTITFVTPPVDKGCNWVTVARAADLDDRTIIDCTVVEPYWQSKVHRMRKNCPRWYQTGARSLWLEKRL